METTPLTIYGLRLKGDREVRYVGQTNDAPIVRLASHLKAATRAVHNPELCEWLRSNRPNIEAFAIAKVATRQEALSHERVIVALCRRLNHRLLNQRPKVSA